jgi:triosephosphate isomerase (TIM)
LQRNAEANEDGMSESKRRPLVCGNWKMHKLRAEAVQLSERALEVAKSLEAEVAVAPSFVALDAVASRFGAKGLQVFAQNVHFEGQGAFTGEVSVDMLRDVGCRGAIVGHSERRTLFGETDELIRRKVEALSRRGLVPLLCVGETLAQREAGKTFDVVREQLPAMSTLSPSEAANVVLAYEPVWAIGTGRTATPEQAQEVHAYLRGELKRLFGVNVANTVRILYGGSVKPDNAHVLFSQPDIDGGLVGGASLDPEAFAAICQASASNGRN